MLETRIILAGLWVAIMLTYLLGDVLRIFAGDFKTGEMQGTPVTQSMWLLIALMMMVPIIMLVLNLLLPQPPLRWINIIISIVVVIFNLLALPYDGAYDNFLIFVSILFNGLIVWYAWNWV